MVLCLNNILCPILQSKGKADECLMIFLFVCVCAVHVLHWLCHIQNFDPGNSNHLGTTHLLQKPHEGDRRSRAKRYSLAECSN